ncbi:MAG: hypothetical protein CSB06_01900 [Bacteroidia bacterium]|nr:MAG: hypothetical protein CSB06_01900 [Bacteroidia bacterium]
MRNANEPSIKEFKHKSERILLRLSGILTITVVLLCIPVVLLGGELKAWTYLILTGLLTPIFWKFIVRFRYYKNITDAIQINENQLPELYRLYKEVALKMGFTEESGKNQIPPLYVVNGYGIKTFLSSKSAFYENYIVLKDDIANLIYDDENNNINALQFIIAHHLAYVKCNLMSSRNVMFYPMMRVLFLHKLFSKAQQYTADRVACYYFPACIENMINLHITANLGERVNIQEYFTNIEKYENNLFLKFANLIKDGLAYRRIKTLRKAQQQGWDIHGKII